MGDKYWEDMAREVMEGKRKLKDFGEKTRLSIEATIEKLKRENEVKE